MSLQNQWTFLPVKTARGLSRVVKMPVSVSLTVEEAKPLDEPPPGNVGIPTGSEIWRVKGKLDVFPVLGTSVSLRATFYLAPGANRLYFTDLRSRESGRCEVIVVRSLDHLLGQEGTKLTRLMK